MTGATQPDPTDPIWREPHAAEACRYEQCENCGCCAHGQTLSGGCTVDDAPRGAVCRNYYCGCEGRS